MPGLQAHTLLFLVVYALILILPYTKWRDRLPAKPSFYRYIIVLFVLNLLAALGACCGLQPCALEYPQYCLLNDASWDEDM